MPRAVYLPVRRSEILDLAVTMRARHAGLSIDEIAEDQGILLVRQRGETDVAGFAYIHNEQVPVYFESLAAPGELRRVWGSYRLQRIRAIVLNPSAPFREREVFLHELYHLLRSPEEIQRTGGLVHQFSTTGVLHLQEERRANDFTAAVLVPRLQGLCSVQDIAERYDVSERIARCAIELYRNV